MEWFYLSVITLLAATIQSATGFGFGLIAVPVFLMLLDSAEAIQMVMIIILCTSLVDWFKLRGQASPSLLKWLNMGLILGFPFGIYLYYWMDLPTLKIIIAVVILLFSIYNLWRLMNGRLESRYESEPHNAGLSIFTGYVSGLMSTSLAMPGPAVMLHLLHQGYEKNLIRATILTFFIFAYAGSVLLQALLVGVSAATWKFGLSLAPVGIVGVMLGHFLAHKINQRLFKLIVLCILMLTAVVMLSQL